MSVDHTRYSVGKAVGTQVHHTDVDMYVCMYVCMYLVYCTKGYLIVDMVMEVEVERVYSRKMELQCVYHVIIIVMLRVLR